jgi:hypothetical protein
MLFFCHKLTNRHGKLIEQGFIVYCLTHQSLTMVLFFKKTRWFHKKIIVDVDCFDTVILI